MGVTYINARGQRVDPHGNVVAEPASEPAAEVFDPAAVEDADVPRLKKEHLLAVAKHRGVEIPDPKATNDELAARILGTFEAEDGEE